MIAWIRIWTAVGLVLVPVAHRVVASPVEACSRVRIPRIAWWEGEGASSWI